MLRARSVELCAERNELGLLSRVVREQALGGTPDPPSPSAEYGSVATAAVGVAEPSLDDREGGHHDEPISEEAVRRELEDLNSWGKDGEVVDLAQVRVGDLALVDDFLCADDWKDATRALSS